MATCAVEKGMLFWKKPCGAESLGNCRQCGRFVCGMHAGRMGDGSMLCVACVEQQDDSTGTIFTSSAIAASAAAFVSTQSPASSAADQGAPDSWHGTDVSDAGGGSDSSSSDSGSSGGDSGGSSSD